MGKKIRVTIGTFDLAKGIAMTQIIVCHMKYYYAFPDTFGYTIWLYFDRLMQGLMPMLFMMSGYRFIKAKSVGDHLKKSIKDFLRPYFIVMLVVAICFPICRFPVVKDWSIVFKEDLKYILAFLLGISRPEKMVFGLKLYDCAVVWFFFALFVAQNMFNIIIKIKNECVCAIVVAVCALVGYYCGANEILYFCIPQGMMGIGYFYLGYLIRKYKLLQKDIHWSVYAAIIAVSVYELLNGGIGFAYAYFANGIWSYLAYACIGLFLFRTGIGLDCLENKVADGLRKVGRYTYLIMCIHSVELISIPWYYRAAMYADSPMKGFLLEIILKIIVIVPTCVVLNKLISTRNRRTQRKIYE